MFVFFLAFFIAQVLSEKVAKALKLTGGSDAKKQVASRCLLAIPQLLGEKCT